MTVSFPLLTLYSVTAVPAVLPPLPSLCFCAPAPLLDQIGFDTVDAGALAEGSRFERCRPVYCRPLGKRELQEMLIATTPDSMVPEGNWLAYRTRRN